jgi:hypothetical protein
VVMGPGVRRGDDMFDDASYLVVFGDWRRRSPAG